MRRALGISRWAETSPSSQNRSPERNIFHRDSILWITKDNGDPTSPLSIERLPQVARRKLSKVARLKPKRNVTQNREKEKRLESESHFPFFVDTTPTPVQDDRPRKKRCKNFNDSVILLDSPISSGPISQTARKESVDTVDLCSDSEEEQAKPQKRSKVKKKTTEQNTKTNAPENGTPDVIVLDDDEESVNILCDSNSSKIKESAGTKSVFQPSTKNKSSKTKSDKTDPSHVQVQYPEPPPGPSNNGNLDTRIVSSLPNSLNFSVTNIDPNATSLSNQDAAIKVPNLTALSSIPIVSTSAGPMTSFGSSKSVLTNVNVSLPPFINKLNDLSNTNFSENNLSHPKNVLIAKNSQTSANSCNVGSNVFNPNGNIEQKGLRPIIIDGCNVAIAHGGDRSFSVRGLCICVEYFLRRGHTQVLAVVPLHQRCKVSHHDRNVMESLRIDNHLVFTPSRYIDNRLIASYDDRYIVQYAAAVGGVIVSRDNYRDLLAENPAWRDTILNRLLMPTWVGDMLMFPVDPLGKKGPTLDEFLCFPKK